MKICRYTFNEKKGFGIVKEDFVFPVDDVFHENLIEFDFETAEYVAQSSIDFLLPVEPSKIVCVGRNYAAHASELGNDVPQEPMLFLKAPSALISDGEPILIPSQSNQVEHEAELAVVIGRDCKNISSDEDAFKYVLGFICLNDVTARDLQKKDVQFTRAKSFDTFCPISQFIETEIDVRDLHITAKVNGIIKQNGRTSEMIFPVDFLIRYISNQMTLRAGDIIATGTPAGVSKLNPGDVCRIEIEKVGAVSNPVQQS